MAIAAWQADGSIAADADTAGLTTVDLNLATPHTLVPYYYPGDVQAGDLLLLATVSCATPGGFTPIASVGVITPNSGLLDVSYKIATGDPSEQAISVPIVALNGTGAYLRIRGARPLLSYGDGYFDGPPQTTTSDTGAALTPSTSAANVRITLPSTDFTSDVDSSTDPGDRMMATTGGGAFTDGVAIVGKRVDTPVGVPIPGATYTAGVDTVGKTVSFLIAMTFTALTIGAVAIG